ncbi:MAG TPA: ribosomal-processing cysteine protease Prp [Clostridia bacterium]|nr:ribosomal-processing cysteine protease Prp [Clostridia bacterium]
MTTIRFFRDDNNFIHIVECEGHTGYDVEGYDIVCAALSSIVQTAVLGLMQIAKIAADYKVDEKTGYLRVALPKVMTEKEKHDADIILKTLYLGASDLYEGFSDYITLEVKNDVY